MVIITIASLVCVATVAGGWLLHRRRLGFSGLDNGSVSRQWLMQHQVDDRS